MNFSCTNQEACPVILDSKCVIYEGENLLYIGVNTNDNYRVALEKINTTIQNLVLSSGGITELTGDVVAVGPGIATATLATVNNTPGQFGSSTAIPKLTVDGKGRITTITTEAVFIPSGALSFIGDVTGTGNTGSNTTLTLATVNSNVYTTNNFLKFAVNAKGLITSATPVSSSDIITTLGYTPYNATNPAGYISTISGIVAGGELAGTYPNPTLVNAAVTAKVLTGVNITGGSINDTDSILTAFGKVQNQINGLIGGSIYQGTWNASTNTPALASGVGTKGHYYIVNVPGSTNLDGITDWALGDWAIFDGTAWQQVDNTDAVVSVNGFTGAVSLTTDNIPEGLTNQYFLNSRARLALGLTTTGSTGPATYDNITGVFNIPDYSAALSGYVPVGRTLTINGTTYDLSANRSWTISGTMPAGGTAGQILAKIDGTDYNTEWIDNYATQVKNTVKLGAALTKGTAVYVSGADGTNMIVSAASNTTEMTSSKTFGLLETGGALNDQVKVVTYGLLAGLDTSTAVAGDPVWLGANGALLFGIANKPYAPLHLVYIGEVTRVQQNNGEIFINIQNGFEMDELHNVSARNPANNAILAYNTSTSLWEKNTIAGALGYTPVPTTRTLTINGTAYDLSADRSWTISGGLSGSGTTNYVSKWTGSGSLGNSLMFDNGTQVTIGATNGLRAFNIYSGTADNHLAIYGPAPSVSMSDAPIGTYQAKFGLATSNGQFAPGAVAGDFVIISQTASILFNTNSNTLALRLAGTGAATFANSVTAGSFVKSSGTASQILAADGSVITAGTGISISGGTISSTVSGGVSSFNTRTGAITLTLTDVTGALGYTPYNSTNPNGYITSSGSITGDAGSLSGRTVGTSTNNIPFLSATRNLVINNPESYSGEVRLGAAWDRGGVYASNTLSLGTSASEIHFVFSNATKAYFNSLGNLYIGQSNGWSSIYMGDSDEGQRELHCNSNRIGFLTQAGGWGAYCDDSGNWTAVGDVTAYSDARVKENIKTIENPLEKILSLRGVSYTRIDSDDKKTKIGVIAQETLPIVPEVVNQDNDGMYNVSYGNFAGLFIEGFKEQQKKIEAQDKIIEELKSIINGFTK